MSETKIKKCPHCGGSARLTCSYSYKIRSYFVYVKCDVCGSQGKGFLTDVNPVDDDWNNDSCDSAIRVWNMRTPAGDD